jgi:hypothetical protein
MLLWSDFWERCKAKEAGLKLLWPAFNGVYTDWPLMARENIGKTDAFGKKLGGRV